MFGIGFNEIIIILVLALIIIGPKKLPDIAKALGKGYREFRKAFDEVKEEFNVDLEDDGQSYDEIRKIGKKDSNAKAKEEEKKDAETDSRKRES